MTTKTRPKKLHGITHKIETGCGTLYVTINDYPEGTPFEVFVTLGKAGGCPSSQTEAIGRLASLILRNGLSVESVSKHLTGIGCHYPASGDKGARSCSDAISMALREHGEEEKNDKAQRVEPVQVDTTSDTTRYPASGKG